MLYIIHRTKSVDLYQVSNAVKFQMSHFTYACRVPLFQTS